MFPRTRHPGTLPIGQPRPTTGEADFIAAWLGHVAAGRIGKKEGISPEQLAVLRANEVAVLGHAPSFAPPPAGGPGWER